MKASLLSALAASAACVAAMPTAETCSPIHIIVTRASTEPPGYGVSKSLLDLIKEKIPTATSEWIKYPATLEDYNESFMVGVNGLTERLKAYTSACKDSKLVLIGYSQGAHVTGDVLCGVAGAPGDVLGEQAPATVGPEVSSKISAIIQMGDPRFMAGLPFDVGTSKLNGAFERLPDQMCPPDIASKIQSYCDFDDIFCAGGTSLEVHMNYTLKYNDQALDFVMKKLGM